MRIVTSQSDRSREAQRSGPLAVHARLTPDVDGYVFGEYLEAAPHQTDRAVRVPTCTSSRYFVESPLEACKKTRVCVSTGQPHHIFGNGRQPEDARSTLACALVGQVTRDSR
jgi:hypothetical protein